MTKRPQPKWDDPEESQRFIDEAKAAEASDDPREFEKALNIIARARSRKG